LVGLTLKEALGLHESGGHAFVLLEPNRTGTGRALFASTVHKSKLGGAEDT
jgi:hypothetical protein